MEMTLMAADTLSRRTLLVAGYAFAAVALAAGAAFAAMPTEDRIRHLSFVTRAPGMSHEEFIAALYKQAEASAMIPQFIGVEITDGTRPSQGFDIDATIDVWTKTEADYKAALRSTAGTSWWAATDKLLSRNTTYVFKEHTFIPPKARDGTSKNLTLLVRKDGMTHQQFNDHWLGIHGPLASTVDTLQGFVLNEVVRTEAPKGGLIMPEMDGVAEIWDNSPRGAPGARSPAAIAWGNDGNLFIQRDKGQSVMGKARVFKPLPLDR
jgi:hypothetical protein